MGKATTVAQQIEEAMMFLARFWMTLALVAMLMAACNFGPSRPEADHAPIIDSAPSAAQAPQASSPTPEELNLLKSLKQRGAAPELGNQVWLNSPPLRLAELRGKVVVIDFWTFG
jgi:hypothetical protein